MYLASVTQLAPAQAPVAAQQPRAALAEMAQAPAPPTIKASPAQEQELPKPAGELLYAGHSLKVLYFDLQSLSPDDLVHVRNSAQTIVGSRLADGDLAAIMTNTGAVKVVQDFTGDRSLLIQRIESLQGSNAQSGAGNSGQQLVSLEAAVKMLGALPEKKALIYFGSRMTLNGTDDGAQLRRTIYAALGANVAFYPVDVRALADGTFFQSVVTASPQPPYPNRHVENPRLFPDLSSPPRPQRRVDPEYPPELRAQQIQGVVTLAVTVGVDGIPKDIHVTQSADPRLDAQAIAAASLWLFLPARRDGRPVEAAATLQFIFRLE
jgi:TonB family protein